jgi:capsular exopolysaccharide synthesis family protein
MSQAEILRIIDVEGVPQSKPNGDGAPQTKSADDGSTSDYAEREAIVSWEFSPENVALVLRRQKPTVALEQKTLPKFPDSRLVMINQPASAQARSYRALRHRLLATPEVRVIAVTSARPGDGKTTCAANLALALGEDTMVRVLLIDANLRRPALARVFGFMPEESLLDHIARSVNLSPPYPVANIDGTRVHVAALPIKPPTRLERSLFNAAMYELRTAYDYIVVDAASVLESADADIVGECADAALLVLRAGVSRRTDLRRAVDQLAPAPVLGTVLLDA